MLQYKNRLLSARALTFQIVSHFILFLFLISWCNFLLASQVVITLDASPDPRVTGHKLYFAKDSKNPFVYVIDLKDSTSYLTPPLQKASVYYFGATAYDQYGRESSFSDILSYQTPWPGVKKITVPDKIRSNETNNIFFAEDFQDYLPGDSAMHWFETDGNNNILGNNSLFEVYRIKKDKVFGINSTDFDICSHYTGPCNYDLSSFEFSGRMMRSDDDGGIGVTFSSDVPFSENYYGLKASGPETFQIVLHSRSSTSVSGTKDSDVIPWSDGWYHFRIIVWDTGMQTKIHAKIWWESDPEPFKWQIHAFDDTADRLVSGTFGLWGDGKGFKYWDDLMVRYLNWPDRFIHLYLDKTETP